MFSSNNKPQTSAQARSVAAKKISPSVISSDMNVLGNIISEGFVDIDGRIEGNIKCHSTTIRENGRVNGDVIADMVTIHGTVIGLVKAKSVILHSSAHVEGVIMHESLSIEDGAFVDGKFKRTDKVFIDDDAVIEPDESMSEEDEMQKLENIRLISQ
ncbi:MAG: cell shape determination protein CcmA [Rickettsiales bacterium]|nr:cell shape determination protein CcmA [Rickettsiales bacterium]|tara:strand:+ start:125 stop:595 length:471 start_codon:yes stop_codon:yes gene_type:complete